MKKENNFLNGAILPALLKFAIPVLLALALQAMYGAVDLFVVGRFGNNADISAVAIGSQAMLILTGAITGLSMGVTTFLGMKIGEKNNKASGDTIGTSIWIFILLGFVFSCFMFFLAPYLTKAMQTPQESFDKTVAYIKICASGTIFISLYNLISAIFRGLGNSKLPLFFVLIACISNIALDLLFVKHFHMGAEGTAFATIISQAVSVILSIIVMKKKGFPFPFSKNNLIFNKIIAKKIIFLGLPISIQTMCSEVSYLMLIGFVNTLGLEASAGVGVAERIVMFMILIPTAYASSLSAFVAQNVGAGNKKRAKHSMWLGMSTAFVLGGIVFYIAFFHGHILSSIFTPDKEVIKASALFLKAIAIECFILSIAYCFTGYFIGIGRTKFVMIQGILAVFLIKLPYAYIETAKDNPSLFNIGFSTVVSASCILTACVLYYTFVKIKKQRLI